MHIPIWIVESNCIHNIFMPFKYMELLSWCSVPYFTCSVIASCYKTKAQDGHCHHNSKLIVTTRSNLRLGGAFELFYRSSRARSARSGAPWVKKCGKLPIRENLVITWPYTDRPSVRTTGITLTWITEKELERVIENKRDEFCRKKNITIQSGGETISPFIRGKIRRELSV